MRVKEGAQELDEDLVHSLEGLNASPRSSIAIEDFLERGPTLNQKLLVLLFR